MEGGTKKLRSERGQGGFNAVNFSPDHPDEMGLWPEGVVPRDKKLQLYPTNLTYPTAVMV